MQNILLNDCYKKSIELLLKNTCALGTLACSPQPKAVKRNYLSIFSRDASISSLGMIASKDKRLISIAKKNIKILAKYQAKNGQIPNYIKPQLNYIDFWRLGCIDATLWWLIVIDFYHKNSEDKQLKKSLQKNVTNALNWLSAQEHNNDFLLKQGEASDWADIMPRNGKVLYTNALWYKVKTIYNLYNKEETRKNFNLVFLPGEVKIDHVPKSDKATVTEIQKRKISNDFYISFISYLYWGKDLDVYGNSLAILADLSSNKFNKKFTALVNNKKKLGNFPVATLYTPIKEDSKLWRKYMESHKQNFPYQYHNGGTWPYTSCFFAMSLKKAGHKKDAIKELEKIAELNQANNWQFNEWFHTRTGQAHGMHGQSWNAGAFLLAYHYITNDINF